MWAGALLQLPPNPCMALQAPPEFSVCWEVPFIPSSFKPLATSPRFSLICSSAFKHGYYLPALFTVRYLLRALIWARPVTWFLIADSLVCSTLGSVGYPLDSWPLGLHLTHTFGFSMLLVLTLPHTWTPSSSFQRFFTDILIYCAILFLSLPTWQMSLYKP